MRSTVVPVRSRPPSQDQIAHVAVADKRLSPSWTRRVPTISQAKRRSIALVSASSMRLEAMQMVLGGFAQLGCAVGLRPAPSRDTQAPQPAHELEEVAIQVD